MSATVTSCLAVLMLFAALSTKQRIVGAADAAALAAADVAVGALPGVPCERAAVVAAANGAQLASCTLDGLVATVATRGSFAGIGVSAAASAGPP